MMKPIRIITGALLATLTAFVVATTPVPASAGQKFCPPGLAKNKHCTPPGQLKKWTKGHSLPQDVYYRPLSNWRDYDLSPPPYGHVYGSVDGDILLIRTATRLVVDAVILAAFAN
ncbi:MAG: RcnB family protein [Thermohalobaculum sp.]